MRALLAIVVVLATATTPSFYVAEDGSTEFDTFACDIARGGCPETICEWNECGVLIFEVPGADCMRMECAP